MFEKILYAVEDGVACITLNMPEQMNPLGAGPRSMREELISALALASADDSVACVLLNAAGSSFTSGGDLSKGLPNSSVIETHRFGRDILRSHVTVRAFEKPLIVAVQGYCLGAGMGLIAQCDLVIAGDDARFGLVESRMGLPGSAELVPVVGATWAKYLAFTGEFIDAEQARQAGLVFKVEAASALQARARALAQRISRMPRDALILNKASIVAVDEAMGRATAMVAGRPHENLVLAANPSAKAPDGRTFEEILRTEGVAGLKRAREQQFRGSWLGGAS